MTAAIFLSALIAVALLGVLGLVLLGGRLRAGTKTWIERVLAVALYGGLVLAMTSRTIENAGQGDWFMMAVTAAAAVIFAFNGVLALRRGRVFGSGTQPR